MSLYKTATKYISSCCFLIYIQAKIPDKHSVIVCSSKRSSTAITSENTLNCILYFLAVELAFYSFQRFYECQILELDEKYRNSGKFWENSQYFSVIKNLEANFIMLKKCRWIRCRYCKHYHDESGNLANNFNTSLLLRPYVKVIVFATAVSQSSKGPKVTDSYRGLSKV